MEQVRLNDTRYSKVRILLCGIYHKDTLFRDHVWVSPRRYLVPLFERHTYIKFKAQVFMYLNAETLKNDKRGLIKLKDIVKITKKEYDEINKCLG